MLRSKSIFNGLFVFIRDVATLTYWIVVKKVHRSSDEATEHVVMQSPGSNYGHDKEQLNRKQAQEKQTNNHAAIGA